MKDNILASINFEKFLIEKSNFKINKNYIPKDEEMELDIKFKNEINIDENNTMALITLSCSVFNKAVERNYPFSLKVTIVGFFEYQANLTDEDILEILEVNGNAILFPYLRSYITTLTSNSGIPPLIIPTINIAKLVKENKIID